GVHSLRDGIRSTETDGAGVGDLGDRYQKERNRHPERSEGSRRRDPSSSARLRMTFHDKSFNFRNALPAYNTSATPPARNTIASASALPFRVAMYSRTPQIVTNSV